MTKTDMFTTTINAFRMHPNQDVTAEDIIITTEDKYKEIMALWGESWNMLEIWIRNHASCSVEAENILDTLAAHAMQAQACSLYERATIGQVILREDKKRRQERK